VDKYQNPIAIINDSTKALITLAASILTATVTFAATLLGTNPTQFSVACLLFSWACLILVIAGCVYAGGSLTNYLRGTKPDFRRATIASNCAFFLLMTALLSFAILGGTRLWPSANSQILTTAGSARLAAAVIAIASLHTFPNIPPDVRIDPVVESVAWSPSISSWIADVSVRWPASGTPKTQAYVVTISGSQSELVAIRLKP
jgi:hypothetical protein